MNSHDLQQMLSDVRSGALSVSEAASRLSRLPFAEIAGARIDHHRSLRTGQPEAVYGPGKSAAECAEIVAEMLSSGSSPVVMTRASADQVEACLAASPNGAAYWPAGREPSSTTEAPATGASATGAPTTGALGTGALATGELATVVWRAAAPRSERVVVASAGTADSPVATETAAVLSAFGVTACRVADIGLAGLHRFLVEIDTLADADAVIVVAGMEGALATAVAGVTAAPVVAVPTSVGYGAALDGVTALLAMHASCSAGIAVVGIDNGFGAAMATMRTLDLAARRRGQ